MLPVQSSVQYRWFVYWCCWRRVVQVLRDDDTCHMVNSRVSKNRGAFITNHQLSLYQSIRRNFSEDLNIQALSVCCALGTLLLNILSAFAKLRKKTTISFFMSVYLSARPPAWNSSACTGRFFMKITYLSIFFFWKPVKNIQVSLNCDTHNGYFTWRPMYIFNHISLISS